MRMMRILDGMVRARGVNTRAGPGGMMDAGPDTSETETFGRETDQGRGRDTLDSPLDQHGTDDAVTCASPGDAEQEAVEVPAKAEASCTDSPTIQPLPDSGGSPYVDASDPVASSPNIPDKASTTAPDLANADATRLRLPEAPADLGPALAAEEHETGHAHIGVAATEHSEAKPVNIEDGESVVPADPAAEAKPRKRAPRRTVCQSPPESLGYNTITLPQLDPHGVAADVEGRSVEVSRYGRPRTKPLSWWANERLVYGSKDQGIQGVSAGSQCGDLVGNFGTPTPRSRSASAPKKRGKTTPRARQKTARVAGEVNARPEGADRGDGAALDESPKLEAPDDAPVAGRADINVPGAAPSPAPRKRGRPKGSKNKPKAGPKDSVPMLNHLTGEQAVLATEDRGQGLATLAAAAGSRAAELSVRSGSAPSASTPTTSSGGSAAAARGGFVALGRPERCGSCGACLSGDRPCETLSALQALVAGPGSVARPAAKRRARPSGEGLPPASRSASSGAAGEAARAGRPGAAKRRRGTAPAGEAETAATTALGNEGGSDGGDDWTPEQVGLLKAAWLELDPTADGFWGRVAARVGRSAAECSRRWYDSCPTPGTKASAPAVPRAPRLRPGGGAPSKATMKRVVRIAQREARWATATAAAEQAGDDEAAAAVQEKRSVQAATDRYIDQILRKRGGRGWGAILSAGSGAEAIGAVPSNRRAQVRAAGDEVRGEVRSALAAQADMPHPDDVDSEAESDYYWSDA